MRNCDWKSLIFYSDFDVSVECDFGQGQFELMKGNRVTFSLNVIKLEWVVLIFVLKATSNLYREKHLVLGFAIPKHLVWLITLVPGILRSLTIAVPGFTSHYFTTHATLKLDNVWSSSCRRHFDRFDRELKGAAFELVTFLFSHSPITQFLSFPFAECWTPCYLFYWLLSNKWDTHWVCLSVHGCN